LIKAREAEILYHTLPRGGYLVETSQGPLQVGIPPETIKDTMVLEGGVPDIFVLPRILFHWEKGISLAELEFPLYFNFFIKKKKTRIVCPPSMKKRIYQVLQESLFGPGDFSIQENYDPNFYPDVFPDIKKELDFFRGNLTFDDLFELVVFRRNKADLGKGLFVKRNSSGDFEIHDGTEKRIRVPGKVEYQPRIKIGQRLQEPFDPPLFGVTCLGPSHGFDPKENTSGYVMWLNHTGVMIDPPVDSSLWLEKSNVKPKLVDSIILTHCHADHDAGTFQKIIEEGRVTIYTTKTIMNSFLRKFSAVTGETREYLASLFHFEPIYINKPIFINGGLFNFRFSFHSIPTIGFLLKFQEKSFVYSSDHQNDPEIRKKLLDQGVMNQARYDELCEFFWDADVIYHESGIPPLHTPISYLNSLPEEIQKKTTVYHIAAKDFPEDTHLTLATFGMDKTLYMDCNTPSFERTYQVLSLFRNLDFLQDVPFFKIHQTMGYLKEESFSKGDTILTKGERGDRFYLIAKGSIAVVGDSGAKKIFGAYEYFGEVAALTGKPRGANVIAESDVVLYSLNRHQFLNLIEGSDFVKALHRLIQVRSFESWKLFNEGGWAKKLTSYQITWLESLLYPEEKKGSGTLIKKGTHPKRLYILRQGTVEVIHKGQVIAELQPGALVGLMQRVYRGEKALYTYNHKGDVTLYAIRRDDVIDFLDKNPGLIMKLVYDF